MCYDIKTILLINPDSLGQFIVILLENVLLYPFGVVLQFAILIFSFQKAQVPFDLKGYTNVFLLLMKDCYLGDYHTAPD